MTAHPAHEFNPPRPVPQNVAPVNPVYGQSPNYGYAPQPQMQPNQSPQQYPQAPQAPNLQPNPNVQKSHTGRNVLIGLTAASVIGSGLVYAAVENGTEKALEKILPNTNADIAGQITDAPTPQESVGNLKVSYKETPAYQVMDQFAGQLDHDRPLARAMLVDPKNDLLTAEEMSLLSQPLATDLQSATSQQVENIVSYNIFDASDQADQTPTLGVNFMNIALDPRNPNNQTMVDAITTKSQRAIRDVHQATSNHPRKQNFTFMNDQVSDGWVVESHGITHNTDAVNVIEDVTSPDGHEEVVMRNSFDPTDPQVQSEIHRLFGNQ